VSHPSESTTGAPRPRAEATHAFLSNQHRKSALGSSEHIEDRALEIANRLRFVCGELPPEELIELARRMATVELKYLVRGVLEDVQ
jgi:hypothetical protein